MRSPMKRSAAIGVIPQPVGQADSTSTIENPSPRSWQEKAVLINCFACLILAGVFTAARAAYLAPSKVASNSGMRIGAPTSATWRPSGEVVVTCPSSVVGAICPPVMP